MSQISPKSQLLPQFTLEILQDAVKGYWWNAILVYVPEEERILFFGDGILTFSCKVLGQRKDGWTWFRLENPEKVHPIWFSKVETAGVEAEGAFHSDFPSPVLLNVLLTGRKRENHKWVETPPEQRHPGWEKYALLDAMGTSKIPEWEYPSD